MRLTVSEEPDRLLQRPAGRLREGWARETAFGKSHGHLVAVAAKTDRDYLPLLPRIIMRRQDLRLDLRVKTYDPRFDPLLHLFNGYCHCTHRPC